MRHKEEAIQNIPANMKILDPMKHFREHLATIENIDGHYLIGAALQTAIAHHSNGLDALARSLHRLYFAFLREILQRMNDRQFLRCIDINSDRLEFRVKLRSVKHGLMIGADAAYEPQWVRRSFLLFQLVNCSHYYQIHCVEKCLISKKLLLSNWSSLRLT